MTDEIKLLKATADAARAETLMRDELLTDALMTLEDGYIGAWRNTLARDTDARERLWQAVQVVGKIRDHLIKVMSNGKLAQAELNMLAARPPELKSVS
jgi:hypothetical protein